MAREFTKNLFLMLVAIMIGVFIITYFVADIMNRSKIETLTTAHVVEIEDINSKNENFTNHFLQGSITMVSAREIREVGNYHFDFALFWYSNALVNTTQNFIQLCSENCTDAMMSYLASYQKFGESRPYFVEAKNYTDREKYKDALDYYISFSQAGQVITLLRYNASNFLRQAVENLSIGNMENVTMLMENFTFAEANYAGQLQYYEDLRDKVDNSYLFFDTIRPPH
ncbi:MAG: hypothetical protein NTV74_05970 [Euryarchaeota archaeon]|nr:hypothetical protein [Euryarchaeota archaeon]